MNELEVILKKETAVFGFADMSGLDDLPFSELDKAVSFAIEIDKDIIKDISEGPTLEYVAEYSRINVRLDEIAEELCAVLRMNGFKAEPVASSKRIDNVELKGVFPHKTAATRAGLGWIGKSAMLINKKLGSRLRFATVFTDAPLECAEPIEKSYCGKCSKCQDACPADAINGNNWIAGKERSYLFDAHKCEEYKKKHFSVINDVPAHHICGICINHCPYSLR